MRSATPATVEKILDALRTELQPLIASGRPFQIEMHGGPDKHVRLVVTSYVDVNSTEPIESKVAVNQRRK
ncbi:MAG: hypothetical protein U0X20_00305 [Caldilineaceae bacterium]